MEGFFYTHYYLIPFIVLFIGTVFKGIYLWEKGDFSIRNAIGSGGMPSGHSTLVSSIATVVGLRLGFDHEVFWVTVVFASIIVYDAINLRFQTGLHAKAINQNTQGKVKLKESLGHLPSEAVAGILIGVVVSYGLMMI